MIKSNSLSPGENFKLEFNPGELKLFRAIPKSVLDVVRCKSVKNQYESIWARIDPNQIFNPIHSDLGFIRIARGSKIVLDWFGMVRICSNWINSFLKFSPELSSSHRDYQILFARNLYQILYWRIPEIPIKFYHSGILILFYHQIFIET